MTTTTLSAAARLASPPTLRPASAATPMDTAAFQALYDAQLTPVYNYARYRLGDADAEDATADAFARAWAARAAFDPSRGDASPWLWAIVRNAVTDRLRRRAHAPFALSPSVAASGGDHDVHGAAAARIDWGRLVAAVAALPDLDHDIVALRIGAGLGHEAIGAAVGLSAGAVAQRLHRALGRLRRAVDGEAEEVVRR